MSKDLAGLPKGWKVVRLGEISKDIQSGGTPLRNQKSFYEGSIPWVKTLDLNEGVVNCTEEKITEEGFKSIRGKLRPINTVMVAMYGGSGTVGKTGILGISAATNQAVCCIEPNPKVFDSVYLHFYLIGVRKEWMRYAIGTRKDPNISKGIIENTEIILPPLEEQMAIATTLRTIQTAKEARQKELALERERKAALMDYLFTHGTRNEPRKQTELGEIPESWNISKFGQLVEMKNGINFKTEQKGKGILTIDVFNMYSGSIYLVMNKLYRVDVPDIREHFLLQPNDILFVRSSLKEEGVGWASLFRGFDELVTFCGFIIRARLLTNDFIPEYLLNYLRLPSTRRFIVSKSDKVAITNINQGGLSSLPVLQPSKEEQQEIADILSSCDSKIATLEREINLHDELFRAMLEELMTGKLSSLPLA